MHLKQLYTIVFSGQSGKITPCKICEDTGKYRSVKTRILAYSKQVKVQSDEQIFTWKTWKTHIFVSHLWKLPYYTKKTLCRIFLLSKNLLTFCMALIYPPLISVVRYKKLCSLNYFLSYVGVIHGFTISFLFRKLHGFY